MKKIKELLKINKGWSVLYILCLLVSITASVYLVYHVSLLANIEDLLRLLGCIVLLVFLVLFLLLGYVGLKKKKKKFLIILLVGILLYSLITGFVGFNIQKIYDSLNHITTNYTTYSSSIVTLSTNSVSDIKDIGNEKIGRISDTNSVDGYQVTEEIIKDKKLANEIVSYDSFVALLQALKNKEINYIFLPTNYSIMFRSMEGMEKLSEETKIIYSQEKKVKKENNVGTKSVTEPFTILLMGIDSEQENIANSTFNGDALMLLTFNPNTLNTTILSIPRDTYVPISCFDGERKNKITHAAWYGEECVQKTIENFTDIKIDYYMKINFKGLVKLVDALGGIDVDVPISFCEQNSDRQFGDKEICLNKGQQHLNGEQALALSRHRKTINDFVRGQNQQLVIKGIMNQAKNIRSLDTIYKLLDTISTNMETNMSTNQILSFYNVGKDVLSKSKDQPIEQLLGMQRLYISGYDAYIYDYDTFTGQGTRMDLYNFVPYQGSISDVVKAMKINLGLASPDMKKDFSFNINNPYEEMIIGKGYYQETSISLLPNFVGKNKSEVISYANSRGITVNVNYVKGTTGNFVGQVLSQTPGSNLDLTYMNKNKGITITVVESIPEIEQPFDYSSCGLEENKDNSNCKLDNFVGKDISAISSWEKKYRLSIIIKKIEITIDDPKYDASKAGKIIEQDVSSGTSLYDLLNKTIKITYMAEKTEENPGDGGDTPTVPGIPDEGETN